jgi:hypothetical protein
MIHTLNKTRIFRRQHHLGIKINMMNDRRCSTIVLLETGKMRLFAAFCCDEKFNRYSRHKKVNEIRKVLNYVLYLMIVSAGGTIHMSHQIVFPFLFVFCTQVVRGAMIEIHLSLQNFKRIQSTESACFI